MKKDNVKGDSGLCRPKGDLYLINDMVNGETIYNKKKRERRMGRDGERKGKEGRGICTIRGEDDNFQKF